MLLSGLSHVRRPPYAIDDYKIYVRDDTETSLAVRDEIVQLVLRSPQVQAVAPQPEEAEAEDMGVSPVGYVEPPRTGVEVIATEKRNKILYHHVRDLRNGNIVRNVTRGSARKLWHYAITQIEDHTVDVDKLRWHGDISLIREYKHGSKMHYDLAQRINGNLHIYYGVTENGIQDGAHAAWRELLGLEEEE